jgi:hypothetical protein
MPLVIHFFLELWELVKKIPLKVWIGIALLIGILYYGHKRYDEGYEDAKAETALEVATELALAEEARRALEQEYNRQAKQFILERDKEYAKRDKVIADWQSGRLRLKPRFSPQACPASGDNAGTEAGLLGEDVQFLIREATRADAIVRQLTACQGLIKDDQTTSQ